MFSSQGAPPVSMTPVANLPPMSTTPAAKLPLVSMTPAANLPPVSMTQAGNYFIFLFIGTLPLYSILLFLSVYSICV
jgi:hypothetical protein